MPTRKDIKWRTIIPEDKRNISELNVLNAENKIQSF
jgi:hypothetical protein